MHMALSATELADGALGLQPSPWTAHASHLKQCLAEVCRQHWLWVARTHCLFIHICQQAAHTRVCVHLVCLLNSQQGWVFAVGEQHTHLGQSLCTLPQLHTFVGITPHDRYIYVTWYRLLIPGSVFIWYVCSTPSFAMGGQHAHPRQALCTLLQTPGCTLRGHGSP